MVCSCISASIRLVQEQAEKEGEALCRRTTPSPSNSPRVGADRCDTAPTTSDARVARDGHRPSMRLTVGRDKTIRQTCSIYILLRRDHALSVA